MCQAGSPGGAQPALASACSTCQIISLLSRMESFILEVVVAHGPPSHKACSWPTSGNVSL